MLRFSLTQRAAAQAASSAAAKASAVALVKSSAVAEVGVTSASGMGQSLGAAGCAGCAKKRCCEARSPRGVSVRQSSG